MEYVVVNVSALIKFDGLRFYESDAGYASDDGAKIAPAVIVASQAMNMMR